MSDCYSITKAADLLGCDKATACRMAKAGELGEPVLKGKRRKLYALRAVEKTAGRKFTPDELAKASQAKQHHFPLKRRDTAQAIQELTVRLAKAFLRSRDLTWLKAIAKAGASPVQIETIKQNVCAEINAMAQEFSNPKPKE
jgi:hypothetical protein